MIAETGGGGRSVAASLVAALLAFAAPVAGAALVVAAALVATEARAQPQDWPQRPLRMVVPVSPGGGADMLARLVAARASERLGQPIVVENRSGAGGDIGIEHVARSAPDGYTIMLVQTSLVVNPALRQTPYDPIRDFAPVTALVQSELWLVSSPRFPANTVAQAVEVARSRPAGITCASGGGILQLACELFKVRGNLKLTTLLYKGTTPAMHDVMIGEVDLSFATVSAASGHVQTGRLKVLGSSDASAEKARASGIPAVAQTLPGFELTSWQGIVAPAGTPRRIVERLDETFRAVLAEPETRERLLASGYELIGAGPERFRRIVATDAERFAQLVRDAGIRR